LCIHAVEGADSPDYGLYYRDLRCVANVVVCCLVTDTGRARSIDITDTGRARSINRYRTDTEPIPDAQNRYRTDTGRARSIDKTDTGRTDTRRTDTRRARSIDNPLTIAMLSPNP
jgi:hypothetical protein